MGRISAAVCPKINMNDNKINFWQETALPYSWYPKNVTELWSGTDDIQNQDPNWIFPITYKFNKNGFRTHEFDHATEKINLALGCSQTLGIGLPVEMTWPFLIEKETNIKTYNLGLGGASSDTVARLLTNISSLFNIHSVYILWPTYNRFENYNHNNVQEILPNNALIEHVWYMNEYNSQQRFFKNQAIVYNLKKLYNFNLHELYYDTTDWRIPGDLARDRVHSGFQSNLNLVNLFLTRNR
jgi:hypothetical protein